MTLECIWRIHINNDKETEKPYLMQQSLSLNWFHHTTKQGQIQTFPCLVFWCGFSFFFQAELRNQIDWRNYKNTNYLRCERRGVGKGEQMFLDAKRCRERWVLSWGWTPCSWLGPSSPGASPAPPEIPGRMLCRTRRFLGRGPTCPRARIRGYVPTVMMKEMDGPSLRIDGFDEDDSSFQLLAFPIYSSVAAAASVMALKVWLENLARQPVTRPSHDILKRDRVKNRGNSDAFKNRHDSTWLIRVFV